ncbi:Splicing factor 3a, subunit 3 [Pseudoloma neurophilia]|uniref:Splicing factor 3a, subunit 3 n=1 Tax=Pseudoloma neurophilia TaxID=146866 RepID=A0A0R0LXV7_9MICR|nr:Splicing factor 3a, subunit 3 [Pseudoloma neurophilia]
MLPFYEFLRLCNLINTSQSKLNVQCNDFSLRAVLKDRHRRIKLKNRIKKAKHMLKKILFDQKYSNNFDNKYEYSGNIPENFISDIKELNTKKKRTKIPFDNLFSTYENYGTVLDLKFITEYVPMEYIDILQALYDLDFDILYDKNSGSDIESKKTHVLMLLHLQAYLIDFLLKAHPEYGTKFFERFLEYDGIRDTQNFLPDSNHTQSKHDLFDEDDNVNMGNELIRKASKKKYVNFLFIFPNIIIAPYKEKSDFVYCSSCKKILTKSVFDHHMVGKKHLVKMKKNQNHTNITDSDKKLNIFDLNRNILQSRAKFLSLLPQMTLPAKKELMENIKMLLVLLEDEHKTSISLESVVQNDEDQTVEKIKSSLSTQHFDYLKKEKHFCGLCDDIFTSRKCFDGHFLQKKHISHLENLGISDYQNYKGLSKIENIKKMQSKLKNTGNKEQKPTQKQ